jgi:DNA processing protein
LPSEDLLAWVALTLMPGLGPILARRSVERFGSAESVAFRVPAHALASVRGIGEATAAAALAGRAGLRQRAQTEIRACQRDGVRIVPAADPSYPAAFESLADPPLVLFVKGELAPAIVRIAIVGSRRATAYGRRVATGLAAGLAQRGIEVVSGGARGIDSCAHLGALEGGGRTVAVLGCGFRHVYPPENAELFRRIAANGAVVSEFPFDAEPKPEHFPRRNRLISGLSAAVVVVEAAPRSGSSSTVSYALEQGREVMAVPGTVSSELSQGCHQLIQQGAKLVQNVQDVIDELSPMYTASMVETPESRPSTAHVRAQPLTEDEVTVLRLLDDPEPVHIDVLADQAPFGVARLHAALFGLELKGSVEQLPGRYYLARPL